MMRTDLTRRNFLQRTTGAGALAGLAGLDFLPHLAPVSAAEAQVDSQTVRFTPDIEPLVRLLEETPREKLLEVVAQRIKAGLAYRDVLAALQLAGVRNIEPRPLGFKFHSVLVVNSAHLASLASPAEHRWLPIFWALDYFKSTQATQLKQHPWTLPPARESRLPSPEKAKAAFIEAMEAWDPEGADVAITSLARSAGEQEIFELLFRFGARDFRDIGHKAIYVANSRRALDCIGWHNSEAVLRSLAFGLLEHEGDNPAKREAPADQAWRTNLARAKQFPENWSAGRREDSATTDLLAACRQGSPDEAAEKVVSLIVAGVSPQSVWDAIFVGAGEVLMRERKIVGLHAVTTANALHFAFQTSGHDETRRMLLLQAAAFLPHFRDAGASRGQLADVNLEKLEPLPPGAAEDQSTAEILADISRDKLAASRKVLSYVQRHPQPTELIDAARLLIFLKGNDAHDYKFSSAVFEDYLHVSPAWRARYLAASPFWLRGSGAADNALVQRTRAALNS